MIRDRGRIKWTSMMLPEHVKLLRDWAQEDTYEQRREMDEQALEQMNLLILEAIELDKAVTITHYCGKNYEITIGKIRYWAYMNQQLQIVDRFDEIHHIPISKIADVRFTDE